MRPGDERLAAVVPTERQIRLQDMELYAFVHFTVNTFTDREWGDGTEDPAIFAPTAFDADQWTEVVSAAGMKGIILTCKHHDGFCLWPSKVTEHSVASSPFWNGKGDVVREVADACRRAGLRFGVYLSPWDRNQPLYGTGKPYDDYFVAQLTELLTGYGDIFCVWFDGACGEGPSGRKQYYDWERYYATIRALQPDATIHVCGPDIRWCGNEAGQTRDAEWSVVPLRTKDTEKIASMSQQKDDDSFRMRKISARDRDLGSREILRGEDELIWYPAEVNTSIRPGWFWHAAEDDKVKPLSELVRVYEGSVGGNATMLLNIPPTREGLFHENDVRRLRELGQYLRESFGHDLLPEAASLTASASVPEHPVEDVLWEDETYFLAASGDEETAIEARWERPVTIGRVVLREQLRLGQRVERFIVEAWLDGAWQSVAERQVIGHKRIVKLGGLTTDGLRIRITDHRAAPAISFLGVYGPGYQG